MNNEERNSIETLSHDVTNLDTRMTGMESVMKDLVTDTMENRQQLGTLIAAVGTMNDTVKAQGEKLDAARTQRTPPGAIIGAGLLALALIGGILWPTNKALNEQYQIDNKLTDVTRDLAVIGARQEAGLDHAIKDIDNLKDEVINIKRSRFDEADGQRLERRIDRLEDYLRNEDDN